MTEELMLTTLDNPFDPFEQFEEWFAFDRDKGYNTLSYLARIVVTSEELSEEDQRIALNDAIQEICKINILGIYKAVKLKKIK